MQELDHHMKGLEAEMEFVTSREKDILTFTRIMRLFNQVKLENLFQFNGFYFARMKI